jgi:hypothetical protein
MDDRSDVMWYELLTTSLLPLKKNFSFSLNMKLTHVRYLETNHTHIEEAHKAGDYLFCKQFFIIEIEKFSMA